MRIVRHLKAWLRRSRLDDELREEMAQHVAWKTASLAAGGVPDAEARRLAALAVGNVTRLREDARGIWGFPAFDSVVQDARYGLRQMRRTPMFSAIAILSLAIGIGASAAVFSLSDAMLLDTLPVPQPRQLVLLRWSAGPAMPFTSLTGNGQQTENGTSSTSFAKVAFEEMRTTLRARLELAGFADLYDVSLSADGQSELGNAHAVSGNYFDVLRLTPAVGRLLGPADDRPDAPLAAVITDTFWRRRFGGAPDVAGRPLAINGLAFTIAGVAPAGFRGTGQLTDSPDVFVALSARGRVNRGGERDDDPNFWWVLMVGRLRDGVKAADVKAPLDAILKRTVSAARPKMAAADLPSLAVLDGSRGQYETRDRLRDPLRTMAAVVGIVLLVACANVANLLLARGQARARELSVRTAIGAPRRRIVRQLFTECAVLAVLGAARGALAARWISAALLPALTTSPGAPLPGLDARVLAFVTVLAVICAIAFALAPAIRSTRGTLTAGLREASARGTGPRRGWLAGTLVIAQLALSMVLIVTAALLARSLRNLDRAELGFDARDVLTFSIDPTLNGYTPERVREVSARILEGLRAMPGVAGATFTSHPLLSHSSSIGVAATEGTDLPEPGSAEARAFRQAHSVWRLVTGADFFATMRLPIVRGRALDQRDTASAPPAMVVNRLLAQQLFKTEDVVGRRVRLGLRSSSPLYEIVGVSANARYTSVREEMPPTAYLAAAQQPVNTMTFEVRTAAHAEAAGALARDVVGRIDDQLPLVGMRTLEDQLARSLRQERLFARLAMLLGAVAVLLSAAGLYGLLAYGVAQRVPEIGLRMALGAGSRVVRWMVLRQSLVLGVAGLVLGGGGAIAAGRLVAAMLYEVPPRDPLAVGVGAAIMLATCVLAAYLPARRASRVDPLIALREN